MASRSLWGMGGQVRLQPGRPGQRKLRKQRTGTDLFVSPTAYMSLANARHLAGTKSVFVMWMDEWMEGCRDGYVGRGDLNWGSGSRGIKEGTDARGIEQVRLKGSASIQRVGGRRERGNRDSRGSSLLRTESREYFWGGARLCWRQAEAGCPAHEITQRSILWGKHWRREVGRRESSGSLWPKAAEGLGVMCWGGLGQRSGGLMFEGGQKRRPRGRQRRRAKHVMGKPGASDDVGDSS